LFHVGFLANQSNSDGDICHIGLKEMHKKRNIFLATHIQARNPFWAAIKKMTGN